MPSLPHTATLICHPRAVPTTHLGVKVTLSVASNGRLSLAYSIEGDTRHVRIPSPHEPRIGHDLWKHTCCECFIAVADHPSYHELNLSPSCEWAAYAFHDYREGTPLQDETLDPLIAVRNFAGGLELNASIALERLSVRYRTGPIALGLSAVLEHTDGTSSYWALAHPKDKPDFHDRRSFVLEIAPILPRPGERGRE